MACCDGKWAMASLGWDWNSYEGIAEQSYCCRDEGTGRAPIPVAWWHGSPDRFTAPIAAVALDANGVTVIVVPTTPLLLKGLAEL